MDLHVGCRTRRASAQQGCLAVLQAIVAMWLIPGPNPKGTFLLMHPMLQASVIGLGIEPATIQTSRQHRRPLC